MLDAVVDYRKNPNVAISSKTVKIVNGKKVASCSTRGWKLCCQTSRSLTLFWLHSSHLLQALQINQPLTGAKVLDTISGPISLGLRSLKLRMMLTQSTRYRYFLLAQLD
ncbi:hypothetical protein ACHAW6_004577 [Cyclotella cf. meneghiniana]